MSKNVLRFAKLCGGNEFINGTNAKNSATETAKFREHIWIPTRRKQKRKRKMIIIEMHKKWIENCSH